MRKRKQRKINKKKVMWEIDDENDDDQKMKENNLQLFSDRSAKTWIKPFENLLY